MEGPMRLCVGIDIGKTSHAAGFISQNILKHHKRFDSCPSMSFKNSRTGFEDLLEAMKSHTSLSQCIVLIEKTGHYGHALEQFLLACGIALHKIHVQRRPTKQKTDKRDALHLANMLYNQAERGIQVGDSSEIRHLLPPTKTAAQLQGLMQRRSELVRDTTMRRNKLTAICDEIFPEFTDVFTDPNGSTAINVRETFPTPADVAAAGFEDLMGCSVWRRPGKEGIARLQRLAERSIGATAQPRLSSLCLEQKQLIAELRLLQAHIEAIDLLVEGAVAESREGRILTSLPMIGTVHAAIIVAGISNIGNFTSAAKLRAYCGWAPSVAISGTSLNVVSLGKGGNKQIKQAMYFIVLTAIRDDTEWQAIYERLIPVKCRYDDKAKAWRGKNKVIGRLCGQIIGTIYTLLRQDYEILAALQPGEEPPDPILYDREKHRAHRIGGCRKN